MVMSWAMNLDLRQQVWLQQQLLGFEARENTSVVGKSTGYITKYSTVVRYVPAGNMSTSTNFQR